MATLEPIKEYHDRSDAWTDFLKSRCKKELSILSRLYPHERSLYIEYPQVERFGKIGGELADEIIDNPGKVREDIQDALRNNHLINPVKKDGKEPQINIRFTGFIKKKPIRDLRQADVGKLVSLEGKVSRLSFVLPRIKEAIFKCPAGHFTKKRQYNGHFVEPSCCSTDGCTFKKLEFIPKRSVYIDSQIAQLQEPPEVQKPGEIPHFILLDMEDDLCGKIGAVDRLVINGILRSTQRVSHGEKTGTFDLFIEVVSIEKEKESFSEIEISEEEETRILALSKDPEILTKVSQSILPAISGYPEEKKGIALQVFSAAQEFNPQMNKYLRGSIHILLAGDPGISKSTLMRLLAQQVPRSIYIAGTSGISSAGLTYAMRQDGFDKRWVVEAGAAPQADNAMLFVDEIAEMEQDDIMALNGILEEQKINYAKAGMVGELNARCATMIAMNPKGGRFDIYAPLADQIPKKIPPQLLSRFDLIYLLTDIPEQTRDSDDAMHILGLWAGGDFKFKQEPPISFDLLQKYIALAKRQDNPKLNPQAIKRIHDEFVSLRGKSDRNGTVTVTKRLLEALIRLATAACIMRFGKEVSIRDAETAIAINGYSLKQTSMDPATGNFDADKISGQTHERKKLAETIIEIVIAQGKKCTREVVLRELGVKHIEITKDKLDSVLDQLCREGSVFEPRAGIVSVF